MEKNRIKFEFLVHDLKVPLAVIEAGILSLLQKQDKYGELNDKQVKILERALRNTIVTRTLVNDALELGRSSQGIINKSTFTPEQLFPDVEWNKLPPEQKPLLAKCKAALTYLDIGHKYLDSNAKDYASVAFDLAYTRLEECCKIEPANQNIINLREKCRSLRDRNLQPVA